MKLKIGDKVFFTRKCRDWYLKNLQAVYEKPDGSLPGEYFRELLVWATAGISKPRGVVVYAGGEFPLVSFRNKYGAGEGHFSPKELLRVARRKLRK